MKKTIDVMKEKRKVSESVRNSIKSFNKIKKLILKSLESEEKTIPELAKETNTDIETITYHLMTLLKYGFIEAGDMDDDDEYYYYKLKNKK
ncbi:MAG: ArsR family transcriptional regulator [Bacteroidales bacterium]|nr:ArsR family transcriptional regulator [Bacteroidales bacterium]